MLGVGSFLESFYGILHIIVCNNSMCKFKWFIEHISIRDSIPRHFRDCGFKEISYNKNLQMLGTVIFCNCCRVGRVINLKETFCVLLKGQELCAVHPFIINASSEHSNFHWDMQHGFWCKAGWSLSETI